MQNFFWVFAASGDGLNQTVEQSKDVFRQITDKLFNAQSILTFIVAIIVALLLGRLAAAIIRRFVHILSARIDKTENLVVVNKLRRTETLLILSIALIRVLFVVLALYFWWLFNHPGPQPSAILGASAVLALIVSGALSPILRDLAYGTVMMAEHWYGVGDHISIDPLIDGQGVVERVTLRSTKIRGVNGEVIWVNNQNIWAVRVTPRGVRTLALELFVSDVDKGAELIEATNLRLPVGAVVVVSPLAIMTQANVGENLWHITAIAEVAPGREWLIDKFAINVIQELDTKHHVLVHDPITRYADTEAERRFARTIHNSRKQTIRPRRRVTKRAASKQSDSQNNAK
jgi:small-conductance mechanosensitive channel